MAVEYLETKGIRDAAIAFQNRISEFDQCVIDMNNATNNVLRNWVGAGRDQFETQMKLMNKQLDDISEELYEIYDALVDSEEAYISEDQAVAKQFSAARG